MTARLIVPERFGKGKKNVRRENFGRMPNPLQSWKKYRQRIWKNYEPNLMMPEHPGRKNGQLAGTWISDLVARRKVIVLCDTPCQSRFYYKRANYYRDARYGSRSIGTCDGCREWTTRGQLYLPEERLIEPSGRVMPGQVWSPV